MLFPEHQTHQQTAKIQAQRVVEYQIEEKSMAPTELHKEAVNGIMMWVSGVILGAVEFAIAGRVVLVITAGLLQQIFRT